MFHIFFHIGGYSARPPPKKKRIFIRCLKNGYFVENMILDTRVFLTISPPKKGKLCFYLNCHPLFSFIQARPAATPAPPRQHATLLCSFSLQFHFKKT
jgi:hypothetical protein